MTATALPPIPHLAGRPEALALLGWTGREAEWLALVCLHSGVFTRAQYCYRFDVVRSTAGRFVARLVEAGIAAEQPHLALRTTARLYHVFGRAIYRALGIEDIRHRRRGTEGVVFRRLLSRDYVLERPELPWLVTEQEKVTRFADLGTKPDALPQRVYRAAAGSSRRYFHVKLRVAVVAHTLPALTRCEVTLSKWTEDSEAETLGEAEQKLLKDILAAMQAGDRKALEARGGFMEGEFKSGRRGARAPRPPTPPDVRVSYPAVPLSFVAPNTSAPRLDSPPTPTTLAAPLWAQIGFRPLRLPRGAPRQLELARRVFSCGPTHIESSGLLPAPRGFALPGTSRPGTMASADSSRPIQRHC